jgi:hypothetical protein
MRALYEAYPNQFNQVLPTRGPGRAVVTYSWIGDDGVQQDDGTYTPFRFSYAEELGADGPQYLVECSHDANLRPSVEAVHVIRRPDGREIRNADLTRLRNLEDVVNDAWMAASRRPSVVTDGVLPTAPFDAVQARKEMRTTVRTLRQQARRKLTPDLLAQIADIYRANESSGAPVQAVATAFDVASSTAFRYVKAARDAGDLEPKESDA